MAAKHTKFHGRVEGADACCAQPGCDAAGEFRVPVTPGGFDGPGTYVLMCLDHVRAHNDAYDYFAGMDDDEIAAEQSPIPRFERGHRRFAFGRGGDPGPAWADFADPLDAIAARFAVGGSMREARAAARFSAREQAALQVFDLPVDAGLADVRRRYSALVRQYHPDRNGGDRSHEARLNKVIEAWQLLRRSSAFTGDGAD